MGGNGEAVFRADGLQLHRIATAVAQRNKFPVATGRKAHQAPIKLRNLSDSFLISICWLLKVVS
jgi:hypothetical protein